ncbi:MAG: MFS transporter [Myxococcota bacterium]
MFYGWRMVGVAFGAHFVASGLGFWALPRLMLPLAEEFTNGDRGPITLLITAMSLAGFVVSPLIGQLLTHYRLKVMMPIAAVLMGLGLLAGSQATALWQLMVVYATAVSVGVSVLSAIGANTLVANWFDRLRPLALGISQFGLSIPGAVIAFVITWTLDLGGWQATYAVLGCAAILLAPLLLASISDRPSDRGLHPDGEPPPPDATPTETTSWTFADALRDRNLWLAGMTAGLCFAGATAMIQNAFALATDAGHTDSEANFVLVAMSVGAAFGKLLFGVLGVRIGEKASLGVAVVGEGVFLAVLPIAAGSPTLLAGVGLGLGLTLGGVMPALAALIARLYGTARFAAAMGYVGPMMIPFQMLGAPAAGYVFDRTGSYDLAIYGFVVACAFALLLLLRIRTVDA